MGNTLPSGCYRGKDKPSASSYSWANSPTSYNDNFPSCGSSSPCSHTHRRCSCSLEPVKFPNECSEDKVAAVVVSIADESSYDAMFTTLPQEGEPGTCVRVYKTASDSLEAILRAFKGEPPMESDSEDLRKVVGQLMRDINLVDNDCVVFNWECCGGCSDDGFPARTKNVALALMSLVVERGSMVMCSDFSLKALIADWPADLLGPNPFVKTGTFNSSFKLKFDPNTLKQCPSSQLQKVGELCADKGEAVVSAMSDTIVYTVDPAKTDHTAYDLKILSIMTEASGFNMTTLDPSMRCEIPQKQGSYGAAGHCLLKYPSGGTLLTSAGHWLELSGLDVSIDNLRAVAMSSYGQGSAFTTELMQDLSIESDTPEMRSEKVQRWSKRMVTSSVACEKRVSSKY